MNRVDEAISVALRSEIPNGSSRADLRKQMDDLLQQLPPIEKMPAECGEVDYYGASAVIARSLGMNGPLPSHARWVHGWKRRGLTTPKMLVNHERRDLPTLVAKEEEAAHLRRHGFKHAAAVGVPFVYADPGPVERVPGSLLIMPAHETTHGPRKFAAQDQPYVTEIRSLTGSFSKSVACIGGSCVQHGNWMSAFEHAGIPWVTGAWIFDANALERIQILFRSFEYMTTNAIGSHIAYALYCGCKVFFFGKYHCASEEAMRREPFYAENPDLIKTVQHLDSEDSVRSSYPFLFKAPQETEPHQEWAQQELGAQNRKSPREIATLFGWRDEDIQRHQSPVGTPPRAPRPQYEPARSLQDTGRSARTEVAGTTSAEGRNCPQSSIRQTLDLMQIAVKALEARDISSALDSIVKAKAMRTKVQGLDYLRAVCFQRLNQAAAAKEALNEELRAFPDNTGARALLSRILSESQQEKGSASFPAEFSKLLNVLRPYTMLSEERLYSLFTHAKHVCEKNLPGNFVECGVAAGGSTALLAYVAKHYSRVPRKVFAFDSFEGMPEPTIHDKHMGRSADDTGWGTGTCSASEESVREICAGLGVLDMVTPVKGYFEKSLPGWRDRVGMIALLHLDGDWYESTKCILAQLYDRVMFGGILQIDDYGYWEGCRKAVHEFEAHRGIRFELKPIDTTGVWCFRPDDFPTNPALGKKMISEFHEVDPVPGGIEGQMSSNERFQLYYALCNLLPRKRSPIRFVEVGSYAGGSLALIYRTIKRISDRVQGFCVEPNRKPSLLKILEQAGSDITHLPMLSFQAAPRLKEIFSDGNQPEFIFIDGDHSYDGVKRDISDYYPLLAPGGIILFHDYLPVLNDSNREAILTHHAGNEPGIRQACHEVMEEFFGCTPIELPLLHPADPTQTQAHLPIIPDVFSTVRAYRKPEPTLDTSIGRTDQLPLKIVHLCSQESGGAGRAAHRVHAGVRDTGVSSTFLVLSKQSNDPSVKLIARTQAGVMTTCMNEAGVSPIWQAAQQRWGHLASLHPQRPVGLELYSDDRADLHLDSIQEIRDADIVNLHWVAGMVDYRSAARTLKGKKIVWTLHDMNPFTGGCHYAGECSKYETQCHACPQLGPSEQGDLARDVWETKHRAFHELDITIVAPSRWLAGCAAKSAIFKDRSVHCIPYGLQTDIFRPHGKKATRKALGIPAEAKLILFGADNVVNTRKGFKYLLDALTSYRSRPGTEILLATFGGIAPQDAAILPYPVINLGYISSDPTLAQVYSMADLFVIPSLADNFPNTILEAMACGVPVVAFDTGGIPDIIEHKKNGFLARHRSVESLTEGIDWVLFDAPSRDLAQACRRRILERYSLHHQANGYSTLYQELTSRNPRPALNPPVAEDQSASTMSSTPDSDTCCTESFFTNESKVAGFPPPPPLVSQSPVPKLEPDGHFYSPLVDPYQLRGREAKLWPAIPPPNRIDFNHASHLKFFQYHAAAVMHEYDYPRTCPAGFEQSAYWEDNIMFIDADARAYYTMLRRLVPSRIIEVGSGFSTRLAVDVNRRFLGRHVQIECIEPYDQEFLRNPPPGVIAHRAIAQDVPASYYAELGEGDILFIDSSHVLKTGSDVQYLYLTVLPTLRPGTIIHIHDIFLPYEYPKAWVLCDGRHWNEQYLVQAILEYGDAFEVLYGSAYAHRNLPAELTAFCGGRHSLGGSLWLRKRG